MTMSISDSLLCTFWCLGVPNPSYDWISSLWRSAHGRLDPAEERLVAGLPVTLCAFHSWRSTTHGDVCLFLPWGDHIGLHVCTRGLGCVGVRNPSWWSSRAWLLLNRSLHNHVLWINCNGAEAIYATIKPWKGWWDSGLAFVTFHSQLGKIVRRVTRFESITIETQVVVLFESVNSNIIRYRAADVVWVAEFTVVLGGRCLEVVIDKPTLFLLAQGEVMQF